jgi:hypothetical protein
LVFSSHMSTVMLSQFVLDFSTGVIVNDGNGLCLSFSQDLHNRDLEAFIAYIVKYKFIASVF